MISAAVRNTGHTLVRVLNNIVVSAISFSAEVISNLISAVLRHHIIILLTLKASYNTVFLRMNINIVILVI